MSETTPTPAVETDDVEAHMPRSAFIVDPETVEDDAEAHVARVKSAVEPEVDSFRAR